MLRYLSLGRTDYRSNHVGVSRRVNWEFLVVIRGAVAPVLPGGPLPFRGRALWIFPPDTPHGWSSAGACVRACFHFGYVPLPLETYVRSRGWHAVPLADADARRTVGLARDLVPHYERPTGLSVLHAHRAVIELALLALGPVPVAQVPRPENLAEERVNAALAWYAEHLQERPGLGDVARSAHVSLSHLRRLFRRVRGRSPHRVFREVRMQRAMELMTNTAEKLSAIAERCGFGSPADFARAFRAVHRTPPGEWRRGRLIPDEARPGRGGPARVPPPR